MRHTAAYDEVIRANVGLLIRLTSLGSTISVAGNGFGFGLFSAVQRSLLVEERIFLSDDGDNKIFWASERGQRHCHRKFDGVELPKP